MQSFDIGGANIHRVEIHFPYELEQHLLGIGQSRCSRVNKHPIHQFDGPRKSAERRRMTYQQLRRDRGVGLRSKRAVIQLRGVAGNQFANPRRQGRSLAHDLLCEAFQMLRRL